MVPTTGQTAEAADNPAEAVAPEAMAPGRVPDLEMLSAAMSELEPYLFSDIKRVGLEGDPSDLAEVDGKLYSSADHGASGQEPGISDGTTAGPWYVVAGGDDDDDCLSSATPCGTINGALNKPGFVVSDTILVASGTYTDTGSEVVLLDRNATLSGGWDTSFITRTGTSTVDGQELRQGISVSNGVTVTVDHFTVRNGYTGDGNGGGIYNSGTLTLTNCTIDDNFAYYAGYFGHGGGGIYNIGALTLINSTVSNNTATDGGGGIYGTNGSSTVIMDSKIYSNTSMNWEGGGVQVHQDSDLSMSRSWVVGNAALGNDGGGIGFNNGGSGHIENSIIAGNLSDGTGGGLFFAEGGLYHIVNSHIVGNEANSDGAATASYIVQVEITNTLIISNTGVTGIDSQSDSDAVFLLSYCDTYGNSPDGTNGVTITRTNCLGTPPEDGLDPLMSGGALPGGVGPAFASEWLSYDYRLQFGSPAIDAGTPTGAPTTDIEGTPRDAAPDMGAYEYGRPAADFSGEPI
jgi:predicted outer membrane repeat protein